MEKSAGAYAQRVCICMRVRMCARVCMCVRVCVVEKGREKRNERRRKEGESKLGLLLCVCGALENQVSAECV